VKNEARRRTAILALKRRFVRFVSHEIRTPLNTVFMGLELLRSDLQEEARRQEGPCAVQDHYCTSSKGKVNDWLSILYDVMDNCQNSVTVLNDILSYDKIEEGTLQLEHSPVNLWKLVRTAVGEFQIQAKGCQVELVLHAEDGEEAKFADSSTPPDNTAGVCCGGVNVAKQTCVIGDSSRLASVVRNLISNVRPILCSVRSISRPFF
jgi:signal transduction histidine kinase